MRKLKTYIPILLILLSISFLCTTCGGEINENGTRITYYKAIGEGYMYDGKKNIPLKGDTIIVVSCFDGGFIWGRSTERETFTTDENGYYQVRFPKQVRNWKVDQYLFEYRGGSMIPQPPPPPPYWGVSHTGLPAVLYPEDIKNKKIITLDTARWYCSWDY